MMREILFRGKRVDNGEWMESKTLMCVKNVDGSEETFYIAARNPMIQYDDKFGNIGILETDTSSPIFYKVIPETVGQYIGLKDKNGKKIFEGDIVVNDGIAYECLWDGCNFEIGLANKEESFGIAYATLDLTVIGNIYDIPELLKGGAE